jgi:hypothetical protein
VPNSKFTAIAEPVKAGRVVEVQPLLDRPGKVAGSTVVD